MTTAQKLTAEELEDLTPDELTRIFVSSIDMDDDDYLNFLIYNGSHTYGLDKTDGIPLHEHIFRGRILDVEKCIAAGDDINFENIYGLLPISYTIKPIEIESHDIYYEYNELNTSKKYKKPSRCINYRPPNYKDLLNLLLANGVDVNRSNKYGSTPLHYAISGYTPNENDIIYTLLNANVNVNVQDNIGYTPLHYAVFKNNPELVEILINAGANTEIRNYTGISPAQLSINLGHYHMYELIQDMPMKPINFING